MTLIFVSVSKSRTAALTRRTFSASSAFPIVLASTHIINDLKGGPNTKMVGLLNLLDANELETKLKEVGIG